MTDVDPLVPPHGGYRSLKSFVVAQLAYDLTVRFCDAYIDRRSRTHDQMVQAARSGVQNIAEGSEASGTSRKMEMKLTGVARASLEELRLDYEDFLRQRGLPQWPPGHPALERFRARRCATLDEIRAWMREEHRLGAADTDEPGPAQTDTDEHGPARADTDERKPAPSRADAPRGESPCSSVPVRIDPPAAPLGRRARSSVLAANAALSLLNVACYLLDRQIAAQARAFEAEGGFTERLHRIRSSHRRGDR